MRPLLTIISGLVAVLGAVWIGTYALHQLPPYHWAGTPTLITTGIGVIVGVVIIAGGFADYMVAKGFDS